MSAEPTPSVPTPEDLLELSPLLDAKTRSRYVHRLDGLISKLLDKVEGNMDDIKTREVAYNVNMLIQTREKLIDKTPPTPPPTNNSVDGLTRDAAIALLTGHKPPSA